MSNALTVMNLETPAPKKKRAKLTYLETKPATEWFVAVKRGRRTLWYLRFSMTGRVPRLYGPFRSKRDCLYVLDEGVGSFVELEEALEDEASKRSVDLPYAHHWIPLIEHPLVTGRK